MWNWSRSFFYRRGARHVVRSAEQRSQYSRYSLHSAFRVCGIRHCGIRFTSYFGAMADRHASPVKVLRGLSLATALTMALVSLAIHFHVNAWLVFASIQLLAFCSSPTWSISSTIVFARLADARQEFGVIRAMATLDGWRGAGCQSLERGLFDARIL